MSQIKTSNKLYALYDNNESAFIQCGSKIGWNTKGGAKLAYMLRQGTSYYRHDNYGMGFEQLAEKYNVCVVEIHSDGEMNYVK